MTELNVQSNIDFIPFHSTFVKHLHLPGLAVSVQVDVLAAALQVDRLLQRNGTQQNLVVDAREHMTRHNLES